MIIKDFFDDATEVAIKVRDTMQGKRKLVSIDFNPFDRGYDLTFMEYTPDMARELAKALISAADEAEESAS